MTSKRNGALAALVGGAMMGIAALSFAAGEPEFTFHAYGDLMKKDAKSLMHMMDSNKDGMVSKKEYMDFHTKMWDMMDKNKKGMVDERQFLGAY